MTTGLGIYFDLIEQRNVKCLLTKQIIHSKLLDQKELRYQSEIYLAIFYYYIWLMNFN